ncbi:MAG: RNA polymerase sigma factor [Anaerolineales bacterium]
MGDQKSSVAHRLHILYDVGARLTILSPTFSGMIGYIKWWNTPPEDNVEEKQAIRRLKRGDISGLEFLVNRHQIKGVRTAYLITRDLALAEDVVQECFVQAYRAIHGFDAMRPFEPWFMRSVVNAAVKIMQRSARQVQVGDEAAEFLFAELISRVESVEMQIESREVQEEIWDAMQKLSPRQRAVIVQRYFLEMSESEMAKEAGTAVGTVKWMLNAARERLRSLLSERSDE